MVSLCGALLLGACLPSTLVAQTANDGLLFGWWPGDGSFDNLTGTNNGVPSNGVTFAPGFFGQAFQFEQPNAQIVIEGTSLMPYLEMSLTIEGWIYPTAVPEGDTIIAARGDSRFREPWFCLTTNTQERVVLHAVLDSYTNSEPAKLEVMGNATIPLNQWTHVAMTLDYSNAITLFVNGQLDNSAGWPSNYSPFMVQFFDSLRIGGGAGLSFRGLIDELKVFVFDLWPDDIQQIYNVERAGGATAPIIISAPSFPQAALGSDVTVPVLVANPGGLPLTYQWSLNGTELPGQTRSTLTLTNLQPSQLGDYTLRASNALGSVTSHAVTLDDWMAPPHLLSYPCNQSTRAGGTATFTVQAESRRGLPLFYQWQIEDTDLPGKTDAILVLTNVQTNDAGLYRIIVSNAVGTASASAMLCVGNVFSTDTNNSSGGITVPGDLANTVAISAGPPSLALQANGIVLAWGSQNSSALDVPAGLRAVSISSSGDYGLAIDRNNTLNGWGNLPYGTPTGLQPVAAVSAGERCGIALMTNGMVSIWQEPTLWPPGDPPAVPPGCTNIVAVAAGASHWLALRHDGVVFAWGDDWYGQVDVPPNLQDVVAIGASAFDSLALTAGGSVVSWGSFGLTSVPPGLSNIVAISAGRDGNLALRSDGSVFQWRSPVMGWPTRNWLTVSNAISVSAGAANGLVLLGDGAPHITVQPWDNSIRAFTRHTFFAKAVGVQPLHYQWLFNGATIPGATQESLRINSPTLSDAGAYTLLVSNSLGSVPSRSASLTVILPAEPLFIPGSAVRNSDGSFGFGISTQSGIRLEIQVSSNLINWIHLSTFRCLSDTVYFTDPSSGSGSRFYRAHVVQ